MIFDKFLEIIWICWKVTPVEMEFWAKFKFDYACCCVTILSLTLGSSQSLRSAHGWTVFRLRPWEKVTSSQCYGDGVGVGPSQEGRTSSAPQSPWRSRGFPFSQWVVFESLMMCLCPILRSRGRVNIGQASLTSKAQVSLEMWNSLMKMFGSPKWEWWIC